MGKKLFIPGLAAVGCKVGFALRNPVVAAPATPSPRVNVDVFRAGKPFHRQILDFTEGSTHLRSFEDQWDLPGGGLQPGDLTLVEYDDAGCDPRVQKFLQTGFEGQILLRAGGDGQTVGVLMDLIPVRPAGHQYAPIMHMGHYFVFAGPFDSHMCLLNYNADRLDGTDDGKNRYDIEIIGADGRTLHRETRSLPYNATALLSVRELTAAAGVPELATGGCSILVRGGASQHAIFTVFENRETGAVGIEHSLPPIYYTEAVKTAEGRTTFYREAFRGVCS